MWSLVINTALVIAAVVGIPAFLVVLWNLLKRRREGAVMRLSKAVLLVCGTLFVLGSVIIPIAISKNPPIQDNVLISIAPRFAEFKLAYTASFGANANFQADYKQNPDRLCLSFREQGEGFSFAGWMIILWAEFLHKFFADLNYPAEGRNLDGYEFLSFQLQGAAGGEVLEIAIKDKTENHREMRVLIVPDEAGAMNLQLAENSYIVKRLSTDWEQIGLDLRRYYGDRGVDLSKVETITFAIYENQIKKAKGVPEDQPVAQTVCIKDIQLR